MPIPKQTYNEKGKITVNTSKYKKIINETKPTNGLAIASLVVSVCGIIIPVICPIVGIILGIVALSQIKKSKESGKGLAVAGIVIGAFFLLIGVLIIGIAIFGVLSAVSMASHTVQELENPPGMEVQRNNFCELNNGFACSNPRIENNMAILSIQNNKAEDVENLVLRMYGKTNCRGEQTIGTLKSVEKRDVIFSCDEDTTWTYASLSLELKGEINRTPLATGTTQIWR